MTLYLKYVNHHILDGVHYLWWTSVFPGGEFVPVLSRGLLNLEPTLYNPGYAPDLQAYS